MGYDTACRARSGPTSSVPDDPVESTLGRVLRVCHSISFVCCRFLNYEYSEVEFNLVKSHVGIIV